MEKVKRLIIGLLFIAAILIIGKILLYGPFVKLSERKTVSDSVENHFTKKYGDHNFKVTSMEYNYKMSDFGDMFDYSTPVGYLVYVKSDVVEDIYEKVSGTVPGEYSISTDGFVWDYYFQDVDVFEKYKKRVELVPTEKLGEDMLVKIKDEFDPSIQTLECNNAILSIPDDFGRIPTMEEIKNDISLYEVLDFDYTRNATIDNQEEYENQLLVYLINNFGGNWSIYFGPSGIITCIKVNI